MKKIYMLYIIMIIILIVILVIIINNNNNNNKFIQIDENYKIQTFKNGLTSLYIPMESELIYIMISHRVGKIFENKKEIECSHFLEHMLAQFTSEKYPNALENRLIIENMGGNFNAFVSDSQTSYFVTAKKEHFTKLMDLIQNAYTHFHIDNTIINHEKNAVIEELNTAMSKTWTNFEEKIGKFLFPNSPASNTISDSLKNIKEIDEKSLYDFQNKYYSSNNTLLTIAGGISLNQMKKSVKKFSEIKEKKTPKFIKTENSKLESPSILFVKTKEADTFNIHIIFRHSIPFDSKKIYILQSLSNILTSGMSSRLMEKLRGEEGLIYTIKSTVYYSPYDISMGTFDIKTKTDKKNVQKVINIIIKELKSLKNELINDKEFERLKQIIKTDISLTEVNMNPGRFAKKYSENLLFEKPIRTFKKTYKILDSITKKQIRDEGKKLFDFNSYLVAYSGPTEIKNFKI